MDKSCSWMQGEEGAPAVLLHGQALLVAYHFCQLGVDVAVGGSWHTGPVLSKRARQAAGHSAACPTCRSSTVGSRRSPP